MRDAKKPICIFVVTIVLGMRIARAAEDAVALSAKSCQPASAVQKAALGATGGSFSSFVIACPLMQGGKTVLNVVAVDEENYDTAHPSADEVEFPQPLIQAPDGRTIGVLPMNFPFSAPDDLDVTFTRWQTGFPHEVKFYVESPAVGGNYTLPSLEWSDAQHKFIEQETK